MKLVEYSIANLVRFLEVFLNKKTVTNKFCRPRCLEGLNLNSMLSRKREKLVKLTFVFLRNVFKTIFFRFVFLKNVFFVVC